MKRIKIWIISGLLLVGTVLLYINSDVFISNQRWKYRDGFHIGDWIDFNSNNIKLTGNSISEKGEKIATVQICFGKMLIIEDINTGEVGHYINK